MRVRFQQSGGGWGNPLEGLAFDSDNDLPRADRQALDDLVKRCVFHPPQGPAPRDATELELEIEQDGGSIAIRSDWQRAGDSLKELINFVRKHARRQSLGHAEDSAVRVVLFDLGDTLVDARSKTWLPGARKALADIRSQGLRVGVISNSGDLDRNTLTHEHLPPDFSWATFDDSLVLLSSEVGLKKPAPRIFELAAERAGSAPKTCLFVTENLEHTLAAQRQNLQVARVGPDSERDFLELTRWLAAGRS